MSSSIKPADTTTPFSAPQEIQEGQENLQTHTPKRTTLAQFCSYALLPFIATRLLLLLVGIITVYYIAPLIDRHQPITLDPQTSRLPNLLWSMWVKFDANFYLDLAQHGYWGVETLHRQSNWAFFPLYSLLIHLLALPFNGSSTASIYAGIIIANGAAVVAIFYLYKLTIYEFNPGIASRAVFYLALFPMSFYLSAVYPESLFLALSLMCVYYARLRRWWLAGLLGGLGSLCRPYGVLLVLVVGWEYWQVLADQFSPLERPEQTGLTFIQSWLHSRFTGLWRSLHSFQTWRGILALLQIPLGLALFCTYAKWKVGTFFPFKITELHGWGRRFADPLSVLLSTFTHPNPPNPYDWTFYSLSVGAIILFLLLLIPIFRRLPAIYGIFAFAFVVMPLTTTSIQSSARFYMGVFPVYMLIAYWTSRGNLERQMLKHNLVACTFAILLAVFTALWTLGVYSMS